MKKEEQALLVFERKIFRRAYGPMSEGNGRMSSMKKAGGTTGD
jgi:hypothetical protein